MPFRQKEEHLSRHRDEKENGTAGGISRLRWAGWSKNDGTVKKWYHV